MAQHQRFSRLIFSFETASNWVDPMGAVSVYISGAPVPYGDNAMANQFRDYMRGTHPNESCSEFHNSDIDSASQFIMDQLNKDPNQPVTIVGYSWGGQGAVDLARKLGDRGVPVNFLGTIDSIPKPFHQPPYNVPSNVESNLNFYQSNDLFLRGQPNQGSNVTNIQDSGMDTFQIDCGGPHMDIGGRSMRSMMERVSQTINNHR